MVGKRARPRRGQRNRRGQVRSLHRMVQRIRGGVATVSRRVPHDPPPLRSANTRSHVIRVIIYNSGTVPGDGVGYPGVPAVFQVTGNTSTDFTFIPYKVIVQMIYSQVLGWRPKNDAFVAGVMSFNILGVTCWGGDTTSEVGLILYSHGNDYPPAMATDVCGKASKAVVKLAAPLPYWLDAKAAADATNAILGYKFVGTYTSGANQVVCTIDISVEFKLYGTVKTPCPAEVVTSNPAEPTAATFTNQVRPDARTLVNQGR